MNWLQVFQTLPYRAVALLIPVCVLAVHMAVMAATLPHTLFLIMLALMVACILPPLPERRLSFPQGLHSEFPVITWHSPSR